MARWTIKESDFPVDYKFLYVSKTGSNANAGTKAAPVQTITQAINISEADGSYLQGKVVIVVGIGIWQETLPEGRVKKYYFYGDGYAVLKGDVAPILIKDGETVDGFTITDYIGSICNLSGTTLYFYFKNIKVIGSLCLPSTATRNVYCYIDKSFIPDRILCLVSSYSANPPGNHYLYITNSTINKIEITLISSGTIGVTINIMSLKNTFINKIINNQNLSTQSTLVFSYSLANLMTEDDVLQQTLLEGEVSLTGRLKSIYGAVYAEVVYPLFSGTERNDYTLKPNSPLIKSGYNGENIGCFDVGVSLNGLSSEFSKDRGAVFSRSYRGGVLEDDIYIDPADGSFSLASGHKTGVVTSAVIDFGYNATLNRLLFFGEIGFSAVDGVIKEAIDFHDFTFPAYDNTRIYYRGDSCTDGGIKYICIKDYPQETPFVAYTPASSALYWDVYADPNEPSVQLDCEYRYGSTLNEIDEANYIPLVWNIPAEIDAAGKGNAQKDFNESTAFSPIQRFGQIRFKLTDNA